MSLRTLLMPAISRRLLSPERLQARRVRAERRRLARGEPHRVRYFHQVDDPYSALVAAVLPGWLARFDVVLEPRVVGPPDDAAAPQRDRLVAHSRRDAALLARRLGLAFVDPGRQPPPERVRRAQAVLVAAAEGGDFAACAARESAALWSPGAPGTPPAAGAPASEPPASGRPASDLPDADPARVDAHLRASHALRERLGHYLGATFHYAGEWYWGLDRLHHLERRLAALGAARGPGLPTFPTGDGEPFAAPLDGAPAIEFWLSLRSPYTAIAAPRLFAIARASGARVVLRPLLPMVMRGLPVPAAKRGYIASDAAREARLHGVPFGTICDPVGRPTERGLAVLAAAERTGRGQAFLSSFLQGAWAEGIDAGTDRGLRRIAERAGLSWSDCAAALGDERWRDDAERHRTALFDAGLWGVPSFRVADTVVWGQDRLWAVHDAIAAAGGAR